MRSDPAFGPTALVAVLSLIGVSVGSLWQGEQLRQPDVVVLNVVGAAVSIPVMVPPAWGEGFRMRRP